MASPCRAAFVETFNQEKLLMKGRKKLKMFFPIFGYLVMIAALNHLNPSLHHFTIDENNDLRNP